MLNLFKKNTEKEVVVMEWKKPEITIDSAHIKKDIQESFQQILNQYDLDISDASKIEELKGKLEAYKEANSQVYSKIETLQSLGLVNTPSVRTQLERLKSNEATYNLRIKEIKDKIILAEHTKGLIQKHSQKYPMFKFITRDLMISIMKKYTLVLGDACFYSREIPQENLEIIKGFTKDIKETEKTLEFIETLYRSAWGENATYRFKEKPKPIVNNDDVFGLYYQAPNFQNSDHDVITVLNTFTISNFKMVAPESHFEIPMLRMEKYTRREDSKIIEVPAVVMNPKTRMFEFNEKQVEEINKSNREVLDPIACLEVEGGFLIMSSWDRESEIPEIQNENWN